MEVASKSDRIPIAALAGVTAALALFGMAQGLSYPLFTILMQRQGMSPSLIGLSAAMMPLGLILSASLVPRAARIFGARGLAVGCALAGALCFLAIGLLQDWIAWFVIRFIVGFVINPLYILGEVWALALAPPAKRGRVMGIFNALLGAGYAAGPLTLAVVGTQGWAPFAVAIGGFGACALMLFAVTSKLSGFEDDGKEPADVLAFMRVAPALLAAVLVSAATQTSTYSLLPVFGAGYGLAEATLAALVTALSIGNIALQIPLGVAAERVGARTMIVFCAVATGLLALLLPVFILTPMIWPVLIVLGAVGYGIYTMALIELGNRFSGSMLIAGNASFALFWGAGGIVGAPATGSMIQAIGPLGLPLGICGLCTMLVVFVSYRTLARRRAGLAPPPR